MVRGLEIVALLGALGAAGAARADDEPAPLAVSLTLTDDSIDASFDVTSAITEEFRKRVSSGIRGVIIIESTLLDANGEPRAKAIRHCNMKYDLWEESLAVTVRETGREFTRNKALIGAGLEVCAGVRGLRLAELARVDRTAPYRLEVAVLLNPVDQETLDNVRAFLTNPQGNRESKPQTFFGALARLFSSRPEIGGERFVFRSGFARPERPAPVPASTPNPTPTTATLKASGPPLPQAPPGPQAPPPSPRPLPAPSPPAPQTSPAPRAPGAGP